MRSSIILGAAVAVIFAVVSCAEHRGVVDRLRAMRLGVWVSSGGAYMVWTHSHYFVVQASGDSTATNIYCAGSRVKYTDRGIARQQSIRYRKPGEGAPVYFQDFSMFRETPAGGLEEVPLAIDENLFQPGTCVIQNGVIYDSISEETDEYILLATCNGDREKIYRNGRSVYLPAGGGEHWSYRIESW